MTRGLKIKETTVIVKIKNYILSNFIKHWNLTFKKKIDTVGKLQGVTGCVW